MTGGSAVTLADAVWVQLFAMIEDVLSRHIDVGSRRDLGGGMGSFEGLNLAVSLGLSNICIESDNLLFS